MRLLFTKAITAAPIANNHARTAAMVTYISAFFSGSSDPFWPHFLLIGGSVLGGIAVGVGIIMESERWSLATILVVVGVGIEAIFTIVLFRFDEGISLSQQSKSIALETRLAPRFISVDARDRIVQKMKQFAGQEYSGMVASDVGDAWSIWREISLSLDLANWRRLPPPGLAATQYGPPAGIAIAPQPGVMVLFAGGRWKELHDRAHALADAITDEGIAAGAGPAEDVGITPNAIIVVIGPKPQ